VLCDKINVKIGNLLATAKLNNNAGLALRSRFGEVGSVSPKEFQKIQKISKKTKKNAKIYAYFARFSARFNLVATK
jgi:hypothetical protein